MYNFPELPATTACMRASYFCKLTHDLRYLGISEHNRNNFRSLPDRIIIDSEAANSMAKCNKDTFGNRHVARRYH